MASSPLGALIDPAISRSWLLVSANQPDEFATASSSPADEIILDLEDAVDPTLKPAAREHVIDWLRAEASVWVRINPAPTIHWADDVAALSNLPGLRGVMLAKTEAADEVAQTIRALPGVPVVALVESALGIEFATAIASAGAFRLAFGSGDYRRDTGTSTDDIAMAYPRSRLVVASRVATLPGPIDGPTVGSSHPQLQQASRHAVALGMTGKLCLQPEQTLVVNEECSPSATDIQWAVTFLADFEARGRVIRDGSDLPRLGRAEKIRGLATAFGSHLPTATEPRSIQV